MTRPTALAALAALACFACGGTSVVDDDRGAGDVAPGAGAGADLPAGATALRTHAGGARPAHVEGDLATLRLGAETPAERTLAWVASQGARFGLGGASVLARPLESVDELGMRHVRLVQEVDGVPVDGAELFAHFDRRGHLVVVDADVAPDLASLDVVPTISGARATELARSAALADDASLRSDALAHEAANLVIARRDAAPRLVWRTRLRALAGDAPHLWVVDVDAHTGAVVDRFDELMTADASGTGVFGDMKRFQATQTGTTWTLVDGTRGSAIRTHDAVNQPVLGIAEQAGQATARVTASTSATVWDQTNATGKGSAVDAHAYATLVYDYYRQVHGRNGIDGQGGALVSTVHFSPNGQPYDNAFWDPRTRQMGYGDGARLFRPLAGGLDVVAHELTHGIATNVAGLVYRDQPGALNEGVADIFGAFVEHRARPSDRDNWLIGEQVGIAGPLRSMANPRAGNPTRQPSHMNELVQTTQDNGGVHINSGIVNQAAWLMTMGGTNAVSKIALAKGVGWEKAEKVWYRALVTYFRAQSDFKAAAEATKTAAKDLQLTADEQATVECAWIAVGVLEGACQAGAGEPTAPTDPAGADGGAGEGELGEATGEGEEGTGSAPAEAQPAAKPKGRRVLQTTTTGGCAVGAPGEGGRGRASEGALALGLVTAGLAWARRRRVPVSRRRSP